MSVLCTGGPWRRRRVDVQVELVTRSPEGILGHEQRPRLATAVLQRSPTSAGAEPEATVITEMSVFEKDGTVGVRGLARCLAGTMQDASAHRTIRALLR